MSVEIKTDPSRGTIESLIRELGLQARDNDLFVGKVRQFPIGLKFIHQGETLLLLCQIRYPVDAETQKIKVTSWDESIEGLISGKKVEISVEDKITWLTVPESGPYVESGEMPKLINGVLLGLERAGLGQSLDKCHYCQKEPVESLTCVEGKVALICESCLSTRSKTATTKIRADAKGVSKALIFGGFASIVGALSWALIWAGLQRLVEVSNLKRVVFPEMLFLIVIVIAGVCIGGPVGYILSKIPNRGDLLSGWMAIVFSAASVLFGELLFVAWLIYREVGLFSLSIAARIIPRYFGDSGVFYLIEKVILGAVSIATAYQFARPKRRALKL